MDKMEIAIENALEQYYELVAKADKAFADVQAQYPEEVRCHDGCISCCHSPFDLSIIEAIALQNAFKKKIPYGGLRSAVATSATNAEKVLVREKRRYHQLSKAGYSQSAIMQEAAKIQLRCALLGPEDSCLLYDDRPITCRLYGIPAVIHSNAHVCGESGFKQNEPYPTVYLDKFQDKLSEISLNLQKEMGSKYRELYKVYLSVPSAILQPINHDFLGVKNTRPIKKPTL